MASGDVAGQLLHAAVMGDDFPPGVPATSEAMSLFARLQDEVAAAPAGAVIDTPWDYNDDVEAMPAGGAEVTADQLQPGDVFEHGGREHVTLLPSRRNVPGEPPGRVVFAADPAGGGEHSVHIPAGRTVTITGYRTPPA